MSNEQLNELLESRASEIAFLSTTVHRLQSEISRLKEDNERLKEENERQEDELVEEILGEFRRIGIDTSNWEYEFGDGNFAHEFIAAGVQSHLESLKSRIQQLEQSNVPRWVKADTRKPEAQRIKKKLHINYKGYPDLLVCFEDRWYWYDETSKAFSNDMLVSETSWQAIEWLEELPDKRQSPDK